ncbi:MAG: ABC transporter transmembrane domain-containing protein [Parvularculaceae bacterium]
MPPPVLGAPVYAASIIINILALGLPLAILQVYDRVLPNASYATLAALICVLIGVVLVDAALKLARNATMNWLASSYAHRLSTKALEVMLASRPCRFNQTTASEHLERLNAISGVGNHLSSQSKTVLVDMAFVPVFALVILLVGGPVLGIVVALFALFGRLAAKSTASLNAVISEREAFESRKQDFIIEVLRAVQTVKAGAMEPLMMRRFERLQSSASMITQRMIRLTGAAQTYNNAYATLSTVAIVSVGAFMVLNGALSVGALACCMLLSSQLLQPLMRSLASWNEIQLARHRNTRIRAIFDGEVRTLPPEAIYPDRLSPKSIAFKNVTLQHDGATPAFENLNFEIPAGAIVAFRGADGSGRSSLMRAFIADTPLTNGEVVIGDQTYSGGSLREARRLIQYVGQTPAIFRGTILDNLTLFGEVPAKVALSASKLLGIDEEIARMPLGYDTMLKSSAVHDVPSSIAQRIAIARAVALRPSVLLLDEANVSLDINGELRLIEAMRRLKGKITIIMTTHRPALIRLADLVFDVTPGNVTPFNGGQNEDRAAS